VAAGQQAGQSHPDLVVLAQDDAIDLREHALQGLGHGLQVSAR
jgi:hypothetical protein